MMSALAAVGLIFRPQSHAVMGLTWFSPGLFMLQEVNLWITSDHAQ
jgi:hypothetical protein